MQRDLTARNGELQIVEMRGRDAFTWRPFFADAGQAHRGHKHTIDHFTQLIQGAFDVVYPDRTEFHEAPSTVFIGKDVQHTLIARVNGTIWCCGFLVPDGMNAVIASMEV